MGSIPAWPQVHKPAWKWAATPLVISLPSGQDVGASQALSAALGVARAWGAQETSGRMSLLGDTQTSAQRIGSS